MESTIDENEDYEQIETHQQEETAQIPEDSESQEESQIHNENLQCRFYRQDFPDENDIVIVSVTTSSGRKNHSSRRIHSLTCMSYYRLRSPR